MFLSQRAELESVYKVYCQNHDEAIALLETYEKDEKLQKQLLDLLDSLRLEPLAVERGSGPGSGFTWTPVPMHRCWESCRPP